MGIFNQIQQATQGIRILRNWLGEEGAPVSKELAQARANVCLQCPLNYKGEWLWSMATSIVINSEMKLRQAMALKVEGEDQLKTCERCGCKLLLKIHVPIKHISKYTPPERLNHFPAHCWMRTETTR